MAKTVEGGRYSSSRGKASVPDGTDSISGLTSYTWNEDSNCRKLRFARSSPRPAGERSGSQPVRGVPASPTEWWLERGRRPGRTWVPTDEDMQGSGGAATGGARRAHEARRGSAPVSRAALGLESVAGFVSHSDSATAPFLGVFTRFSNQAGSPVVRGTPSLQGGCGRKMLVSGPRRAPGQGGGPPGSRTSP